MLLSLDNINRNAHCTLYMICGLHYIVMCDSVGVVVHVRNQVAICTMELNDAVRHFQLQYCAVAENQMRADVLLKQMSLL